MASFVTTSEEITLQDGTTIEFRPLNIKKLRKFMEVVQKFNDPEMTEAASIDVMVELCQIAISQFNPEFAKDLDHLEDSLDVPTMEKIIEVCSGIKLNDPKVLEMAAELAARA